MITKYHVRRLDTGSTYVRQCDEAHMLARRTHKRGPIKVGDKFVCESKLDGSTFIEVLTKIGKVGSTHGTGVFCLKSDAMGINPDHRVEHMKADAELGIPIEYDEAGRAVFRGRKQYARYCESHGFFARNGGAGDPQKRDAREREIRGLPPLYNEEPEELYIPGLTTEDMLP